MKTKKFAPIHPGEHLADILKEAADASAARIEKEVMPQPAA